MEVWEIHRVGKMLEADMPTVDTRWVWVMLLSTSFCACWYLMFYYNINLWTQTVGSLFLRFPCLLLGFWVYLFLYCVRWRYICIWFYSNIFKSICFKHFFFLKKIFFYNQRFKTTLVCSVTFYIYTQIYLVCSTIKIFLLMSNYYKKNLLF